MKIKSCIGRNLEEAIEEVKKELGEDAIIISTGYKKGGGVELRAIANKGFLLTDQIEKEFNNKKNLHTQYSNKDLLNEQSLQHKVSSKKHYQEYYNNPANRFENSNTSKIPYNWKAVDIRKLLKKADVKNKLIEHLTGYSLASDDSDMVRALSYGIEQVIDIKPLNFHRASAVVFVGNVGSGKTISWAKAAVECLLKELDAYLISLDTLKTGAVAQNSEIAKILNKKLRVCQSVDEFELHIDSFFAGGHSKPCIIDSFACNPFEREDKELLVKFIETAEKFMHLEKILVIDAYMSYGDIANQLQEFSKIGIRDVCITKADIGRNIGSLISAVYKYGFRIRGVTNSPFIGDEILKIGSYDISQILCNKNVILKNDYKNNNINEQNFDKIAI